MSDEERDRLIEAMNNLGIIDTRTAPRVDDDATVKAAYDCLGTITSGRLWDGDLLATYRRARAQVVATIAAGLRDAGLTDEATIERLTEAVVKRLGEGV